MNFKLDMAVKIWILLSTLVTSDCRGVNLVTQFLTFTLKFGTVYR